MLPYNGIKGAISNTKFGRHRAHARQEKKEGRAITKEANKEAKRMSRKYESFDKTAGEGKTDEYLMTKFSQYEKRAGDVEKKISNQEKKNGAWSDEMKQAYRRSQLGGEASRIQAYANAADGKLSDETMQRSKAFFDKMKTDLYGNSGEMKGEKK